MEELNKDLINSVETISNIKREFFSLLKDDNLDLDSMKKLFKALILEYFLYNSTGDVYIKNERANALANIITSSLKLWGSSDNKTLEEVMEEYLSFKFGPSNEIGKKSDMDKLFHSLVNYLDGYRIEQVVLFEPRKGGLSSRIFLSELVNQDTHLRNFVTLTPRRLLYRFSKKGKLDSSQETLFIVDSFKGGPECDFEALLYQEVEPENVNSVFVDWENKLIHEELGYAQSERYQLTKGLRDLQRARLNGVDSFDSALFYYLFYDFLYQNISEEEYGKLSKIIKEKRDDVYNGNVRLHEPLSSMLKQFVEILRESFVTAPINSVTLNGLTISLKDSRGQFMTPYGDSPMSIDVVHSIMKKRYNSLLLNAIESELKGIDASPVLVQKTDGTSGIVPLGYSISKMFDRDIYFYDLRKMPTNLPDDGLMLVDVVRSSKELEDLYSVSGDKNSVFAIADMFPILDKRTNYTSLWHVEFSKG